MWFDIIKAPNPYGGQWKDLVRDEYYELDDKNRRLYHIGMYHQADNAIKEAVKPRRAGVPPPKTDDEIRELRELQRFHRRMSQRIKAGNRKENFYSLEEENNRQQVTPMYDAVHFRKPTTKEMYDNYSREDKIKYWYRQSRDKFGWANPTQQERNMAKRMERNPNYNPPFEGDDSTERDYKVTHGIQQGHTKPISEYNNWTVEEKRKYHNKLSSSYNRSGEKELGAWHMKMKGRLVVKDRKYNIADKPTFPTPEEERNA